jgi:membrane fusion protein, multidrug efflux system
MIKKICNAALIPLLPIPAAILLTGCSPEEKPTLPPPEVVVQTIAPQDVAVERSFTAQTIGSREVEIRPRVSGILLKRHFQEGRPVKAGTLLYQIDPSEYQAKLAQAEANLAQQKSAQNKAERDYARLKPLLADKAVSTRDVDDAESALERAKAAVDAALAQVSEAKLNLGYTRVVAPISGITSMSTQAEGSLVNGAQTLLTKIIQIDPIYVNFSISEQEKLDLDRYRQSGKIKLEKKQPGVVLKLSDGTLYPRSGKINFADSVFSQSTGTLNIRAEFPNPEGRLVSGQFGNVIIRGYVMPQAILVPQKSVVSTAGGKIVMTVDANSNVQARPVETGSSYGTSIFINKGLQTGDQVVIEGLPKIQQGKPVRIVSAASAVSANTTR